jgi:hypothetical protein
MGAQENRSRVSFGLMTNWRYIAEVIEARNRFVLRVAFNIDGQTVRWFSSVVLIRRNRI